MHLRGEENFYEPITFRERESRGSSSTRSESLSKINRDIKVPDFYGFAFLVPRMVPFRILFDVPLLHVGL